LILLWFFTIISIASVTGTDVIIVGDVLADVFAYADIVILVVIVLMDTVYGVGVAAVVIVALVVTVASVVVIDVDIFCL
jgi:hypothetical protein